MAVLTTYAKGDGKALHNTLLGKAFTLQVEVDTETSNVGASDVVKIMEIPAGTLIEGSVLDVTQAEGAVLTADLGDYTTATGAAVDADGLQAAVDANAVAATYAATPTAPDFYAAEGKFIGLAFSGAADKAKVKVTLYGRKLTI